MERKEEENRKNENVSSQIKMIYCKRVKMS